MKKLKPLFIILTAVLILFSAVCFPDLLPGTYTVTETPSDRYVAQEPKTVKVEYGKTASVSFENKLKKGNLEIIKTSEDGVVADIEFTVTGKNYNTGMVVLKVPSLPSPRRRISLRPMVRFTSRRARSSIPSLPARTVPPRPRHFTSANIPSPRARVHSASLPIPKPIQLRSPMPDRTSR